MIRVVELLFYRFCERVRSRADLLLEILAFHHQILVLERSGKRPQLNAMDRYLWIILSRIWKRWQEVLKIAKPESVKRWRRQGFWEFCFPRRHKKRGRPPIDSALVDLIRQMSRNNFLWGAPRIHGELLKLGIMLCTATVAKYKIPRLGPASPTWRTFLINQLKAFEAPCFCSEITEVMDSLWPSELEKNRKPNQPQCFSIFSDAIRLPRESTRPVLVPVTFKQQTEGAAEVDQLPGMNTQARASPIAVTLSSDLPNEVDLLPLTVPVERNAA